LLAVVVILGRHTGELATDVYEQVYDVTGVRPGPGDLRGKHPCCELDGTAPMAGVAVIEALPRQGRRR
jgi:hypothetical protein